MKKVDRIAELIKSEFELHPKVQLIDYYKLFFQGTFGPEHIISNKSSARKFLQNELEEYSIFEEIEYQNISYINKFYRVNINVINKGMITFDDFMDAFLKSAKIEKKISYEEWLIDWKNIEQQILLMKIPIENIEKQSAELWKIIEDKQLVSHSNIYRKTYSPHYRLINAEQFKIIKC
ncbi:MAG: hypothetical protein DRH89_08040 [Candidatus Cloacimonadota bacterium]|nr:MAG: hypothetical protein DRH89_08040 [Candidatus Cloacimonadota bacterium]